jgi:hypothetical protein
MTPRQLRRAAERKCKKGTKSLTIHPLRNTFPSPEPSDGADPSPAISASQLAANRANAQLSSGPQTPEGKAKSCLNAVKTGLTGRTVLLPPKTPPATNSTSAISSPNSSPSVRAKPSSCALSPTPPGASLAFPLSKWLSLPTAASNSLTNSQIMITRSNPA